MSKIFIDFDLTKPQAEAIADSIKALLEYIQDKNVTTDDELGLDYMHQIRRCAMEARKAYQRGNVDG